MEEIWKDIKGFEGLYQVSNLGRVKSVCRKVNVSGKSKKIVNERILSTCVSGVGYKVVNLSKNGSVKSFSVHRLVAEAFIPNPLNLKEINHRDENRLNNVTGNLEWCDRMYNRHYGTAEERRVLQIVKPIIMCDLKTKKQIREFVSMSEAERTMGIHRQSIYMVCRGKHKQGGGYYWKYKNE